MKNTEGMAYGGSIITFLSGLSLSDWATIAGIVFGLSTVLINWYYKDKEARLKEMEFHAKFNMQPRGKNHEQS